MKRSRCWFVVALFLATACSPNLAFAQAESLIERGLQLREQGRDLEAIVLLEQAFQQEPSPRGEAQLALAQLAVGEFVDAHAHLVGALATTDAWVSRNRSALEAALASADAHVGRLEVLGAAPAAQVTVNGRLVGAMPLEEAITALAGRCSVDVQAAGYRPFSAEVQVHAGQLSRITVNMIPEPVAAVEPSPARVTVQERRAVEPNPHELPPPTDVTNEAWFWPVMGGGAALVVAGVVLGIVFGTQTQPELMQGDLGTVVYTLRVAP